MPLLDAFNRQCELNPERIAVVEVEHQLNYRQFKAQVDQFGANIQHRIENCRRVVIALERGVDAAAAILSVLGLGACYIPLDMKNPPSRLSFILDDVDAQCVIGRGACPKWLNKPERWLDIDQLQSFPFFVEPSGAKAESLAAILYTSGSTGTPKGVALSHRAMHNFSEWAALTFSLTLNDRIASLAPFHFDLSVFDLFASLSCGAAVHFVPAGLTFSPSRLTTWLGEQQVSVFYTVPSLLSFIALKGALDAIPLPNLRTILFAGEVFPTSQLKILCELLPHVKLYNLFGPTETNVCCYWPVDRSRLNSGQAIPIGHAACGSQLKIERETSELLVQSTNNMSGYWQQGRLVEPLSAQSFYRTGDKVSINNQGEYLYHGRLDRMMKCSGYRVEPMEIEKALQQCPGMIDCGVIGIADSASGKRPAAAVVIRPGTHLADIVAAVKQKLPGYMQPCKYIEMESLPLLSNGKTDYQALQNILEHHV